jgi:hypothetical protein
MRKASLPKQDARLPVLWPELIRQFGVINGTLLNELENCRSSLFGILDGQVQKLETLVAIIRTDRDSLSRAAWIGC